MGGVSACSGCMTILSLEMATKSVCFCPSLRFHIERIEVNIIKGDTRTSEFLTKNLNGKIPILEIQPG